MAKKKTLLPCFIFIPKTGIGLPKLHSTLHSRAFPRNCDVKGFSVTPPLCKYLLNYFFFITRFHFFLLLEHWHKLWTCQWLSCTFKWKEKNVNARAVNVSLKKCSFRFKYYETTVLTGGEVFMVSYYYFAPCILLMVCCGILVSDSLMLRFCQIMFFRLRIDQADNSYHRFIQNCCRF